MENQKPRIEKIEKVWTPDSKLCIPYEGKEIELANPSFGPNNYEEVGKEILNNNLKVPTGEYIASLLHAVYCGPKDFTNSPEAKEIKNIMKNKWFWIFNQNLWTDKGVYVVSDLKAEGRTKQLNPADLEKKLSNTAESPILYSHDKTIRFVPKSSYKLGEHNSKSLAKNNFIIASYGEEGAEKLAEVSTKFNNQNPYVWGVEVEQGQEPIQRVSALNEIDARLSVDGNFGADGNGHAFGVLESCEAAQKN